MTDPKLILLDEPFSGVDPIAVEDLQAEIRRLANRGIACLITDHNAADAQVCDRAYIIDEGKKFAEGTPRELINNEMVRRVYLGSLFRGDEFDDHRTIAVESGAAAGGGGGPEEWGRGGVGARRRSGHRPSPSAAAASPATPPRRGG